jgi:serine/threonine-protein kinase RsbW
VEQDHWPIILMGATGPKRRKGVGPGEPPAAARGPVAPAAAGDVQPAAVGRPVGGTNDDAGPPMKRVFDIPSDFAASRDVQLRVMQDVVDCGFDEESTFAIRISLEEAIVNAIRHGNRQDATKRVRVESAASRRAVHISVEDEGPGFDRHHIPDPTAEENLCRPSGRGILLIESYMDAVRWEHGGRRVHMTKLAAPVAQPAKV